MPLVSIITFLPTIGALILLFGVKGDSPQARENARWVAIWATGATFLVSLMLLAGFDPQDTGFQFVEDYRWLTGLHYKVGVDGISVPLLMLTTFIMPLAIYASWGIETRVREYMAAFLILETLMVGVFTALDLVLFYLFFEGGLIPMFLIIGVWGGKERIYAAFKFFLYTLLGSVLMLIAVIAMYADAGTTDITVLLTHDFASEPLDFLFWTIPGGFQTLLWLAFFASLAVKTPMWPVHTWLPDAHVQAPTAGSVILASVLLKMGAYGFIRFNLPMFPVASDMMANFVFVLSCVAIIYTSLVAMMQEDIKKLIAYSSVAHMGFVTLGIFSATRQGLDGAMFQMISHGFIAGALFLCVGVIYDRTHTREIRAYGGLVQRMPVYATIFMLFTLGNVGLPGTSGFIGEFLTLIGTFQVNTWAAAFATSGVIFSACYGLWLYKRVVFGEMVRVELRQIADVNRRELIIFAPLIAGTLILGVAPGYATDLFGPSVAALLDSVETRLAAFDALRLAAR